MTAVEKYTVTLRCVPEEGSVVAQSSCDAACFHYYPVLAANRKEAIGKAFAIHARDCDQPCGNCEITTETELLSQDLID